MYVNISIAIGIGWIRCYLWACAYLVEEYTLEAGVRQLERAIAAICRHVAVQLVERMRSDIDSLTKTAYPIIITDSILEVILHVSRLIVFSVLFHTFSCLSNSWWWDRFKLFRTSDIVKKISTEDGKIIVQVRRLDWEQMLTVVLFK